MEVHGRRINEKEQWVCAGWFRRYPSEAIQLAEELGLVWFVDPDTGQHLGATISQSYKEHHSGRRSLPDEESSSPAERAVSC